MNANSIYFCHFFECVPFSSNYASVRHVPSLDSISSVMDGLHLQVQEVRQVVWVTDTHTNRYNCISFQWQTQHLFVELIWGALLYFDLMDFFSLFSPCLCCPLYLHFLPVLLVLSLLRPLLCNALLQEQCKHQISVVKNVYECMLLFEYRNGFICLGVLCSHCCWYSASHHDLLLLYSWKS